MPVTPLQELWRRLKSNLSVSFVPNGSNAIVRRLARGAAWSLTGSVANRLFAMITSILVARMLGTESFGAYGMIQSTIGIFGLLAGCAMGSTSTKYLAQFRTTDPARAGRILSLTMSFTTVTSLLMSAALLIFSHPLARSTLNRPQLGQLLSIASLFLLASTLNSVQIACLAGFEAFSHTARINIIQGVATPCIMIPLVYLDNLRGAVVALILTSALGFFLCRTALRGQCLRFSIPFPHLLQADFREWRLLLTFSLPATISGLLSAPATWLSNTFLVAQHNGYAQLGLFNAANQWRQLIAFFPQILTFVMLPIYSDVHGHNIPHTLTNTFRLNLRIIFTIALPLTVVFILLHRPLCSLFGKQYQGTDAILIILMLVAFLNAIDNNISTAITGTGRPWIAAAFSALWGCVLIICTSLLVPSYHAMGLSFAQLIAFVFLVTAQMTYAERVLAPHAIAKMKSILAVAIFTLVVSSVSAFHNTYSFLLGALAAIAAFYPLWQITQELLSKRSHFRILLDS